MRIDLHAHTEYSWDSAAPVEEVPETLLKRGINVQAITDHNTIAGALAVKRIAKEQYPDLQIIVGEEIKTAEGELLGLFLEEAIPKGLRPEETVELVHGQGGLVGLPHGFDRFKPSRLKGEARERILGKIDFVETYNASVSRREWNDAAREYAQAHDKPESSGADAHRLADYGVAWVEVEGQLPLGPEELLAILGEAEPTGLWVHPIWKLSLRVFDYLRSRSSTFKR